MKMATKVLTVKRKSLEMPICKYGSSCYRKNPEHRKKFKHPSAEDKEISVTDVNENSLNDALDANISEKSAVKETEISKVNETETTKVDETDAKQDPGHVKIEKIVAEILKLMPQDFFDFWTFCSTVKKSNPEDTFLDYGYKLVGVFDLLAKKVPSDKKVDISCHWRYFYDPPEFETVIKKDGEDLYHIGYFRDDPSEKPSILASNSAASDGKLNLMGDNIFCAMNAELKKVISSLKSKTAKKQATVLKEDLESFASKNKYSLDVKSPKTKQRDKKVVAKTFHGLGIVVPVKNDVGYRPLPDSNATLKSILNKIVSAKTDPERLEKEEALDEIITNVHFANDECDYGMGFELGIDLFCYGDTSLHNYILSLLPLAYSLLKRPEYASIVKAHLSNRQRRSDLSTLNL